MSVTPGVAVEPASATAASTANPARLAGRVSLRFTSEDPNTVSRRPSPAAPLGSSTMTRTSTPPKKTSGGTDLETCTHFSTSPVPRNWTSAAPTTIPHSEPSPATTAPTTTNTESLIG